MHRRTIDAGQVKQEVRELVRDLERQGWRVEARKGGHLVAYSPDGKTMVTLPSTPGDRRWRQNAISQLRRGGYDPSKK